MNITKLFLGFITRDLASLAKFIGTLNTHIADFVAKAEAKKAALEQQVEDTIAEGETKIEAIRDEVQKNLKGIKDEIETDAQHVAILLHLKKALPSA